MNTVWSLASNEVLQLLIAAMECSVYLSPKAVGLTIDELAQVGQAAGLKQGEIAAAIQHMNLRDVDGGRVICRSDVCLFWQVMAPAQDPEYRDPAAFDFVSKTLYEVEREVGPQVARMERSVLVARGVQAGLQEQAIEIAVAIGVLVDQLVEKDGWLRRTSPVPIMGSLVGPNQATRRNFPIVDKPYLRRAYPLVEDVIRRRSDGRPAQREALKAFGDALLGLGYGQFRLWWQQLVAEMGASEAQLTPVLMCVSAAALIEGALSFVVRHGKTLGMFGSSDFRGSSKNWKLRDLVESARAGGDRAILDEAAYRAASDVLTTRQRIHAGRVLDEFQNGVPDLRPEEARRAKESAVLVVRRVLDWLDRYPPGSNGAVDGAP